MKTMIGLILMMTLVTPAVTWAVPADGPITARPFPEASAGALGDLVASDAASLDEAIGIVDIGDDAVSDWMQYASSIDAGEWEAVLDDDQSVPCEPGKIRGESRLALGALLRNTPADLRGTKYRAPWFQAFPWTKSFPEAAEMSGAIYRYSSFGTVGLLLSTSPWPLWFNPGPPPSTDAGKVAVARGFLNRWRNLILVQYGLPDLVVHRVAANANGTWSVEFRQRYEELEVLGARVLVRGDAWGDVFAMQSSYVPDLAVDVVPSVSADEVDRILRSSTCRTGRTTRVTLPDRVGTCSGRTATASTPGGPSQSTTSPFSVQMTIFWKPRSTVPQASSTGSTS